MRKIKFVLFLSLCTASLIGCGGGSSSFVPNQGQGTTPPDDTTCVAPDCKCGSSVILTWMNPTLNANGSALTDLAGIRIYYGVASGTYSTMLQQTDLGTTNRAISNLAPGKYYFAATAYNSTNAESVYSAEAIIRLEECQIALVNMLTGKIEYSDAVDSNAF